MTDRQRIAFCGAALIDGVRDTPIEHEVVVVEGQKISLVGHGEDARTQAAMRGAQVVDGRGMTLLPGLIDCHVHLCLRGVRGPDLELQSLSETAYNALYNAQQNLLHGITTVRDVGGIGHIDIALRDAIGRGDVVGPRILASGEYIRMTGGHGSASWVHADGVDEVVRATRRQILAGADWIKIMASGGQGSPGENPKDPELTQGERQAVLREACDHGVPVAVHEHGSYELERMLLAGVRTVEHGTYLTDEVIAIMAKRRIALCPTALAYYKQATNESGNVPEWKVERAKQLWAAKRDSFQRALAAGVIVIAGSDSCFTVSHGEGGREIGMLVELGMEPMAAIQAATSVAADVLNIADSVGRIREGLIADLILVKGNPLDDLTALSRAPAMVMQSGATRTWESYVPRCT